MTYSAKKIRVVIQSVPDDVFGMSLTTRSYDFKNLPIEVNIEQVQLPSGGSAVIKIYGVSKEKMDAITTIQLKTLWIKNQSVAVFTDEGDGEHLIYCGTIIKAVPCYDSAPDVYIRIDSCTGAYWNTMGEVPPYSHKGMIPVHLAVSEICAPYGAVCKNFGVMMNCNNPYFDQKGLKNRLNAVAQAYNLDVVMDDGEAQVVEIYPKGKYMAKTWTFTKENYIGYPSFNECGVRIVLDKLYYDLSLKDYFVIKGSEVSIANGLWAVQKYIYNISTKLGGNWLMEIIGTAEVLDE